MSTVPKRASSPIFSVGQCIWMGIFIVGGLSTGISGTLPAYWMWICFGMIAFAIPHPNREGAIFIVTARWLRYRWKKLRFGTVYRRELSSTMLQLQQGVSPLKGLFKIQLVLLGVKLGDAISGTKHYQVPVFMRSRSHTVVVTSGSHPAAALADPDMRDTLEKREASVYADIASILGAGGGSMTVWSLHRRPSMSKDNLYLKERMSPRYIDAEDEQDQKVFTEHLLSREEIIEDNWDREFGISMTAPNPKSWRASRLNRLTPEQFSASRAVSAALVAEEKLQSIGHGDAVRVTSYPRFCQLFREVLHLHEQQLPRDRVLMDDVADEAARQEGGAEGIDPKEAFSYGDSPLPEMQREVANDHLIFDGTYHRVLWIVDYLGEEYDALHTAKCDYFVGIYSDIKELARDDSIRQDQARWQRLVQQLTKRNVSAQDEAELNEMEAGRYTSLPYGDKVPWFRTIIIVSGRNLEELDDNHAELRSHLSRNAVRVKLKTVHGPDQLEWFFAALGTFGAYS